MKLVLPDIDYVFELNEGFVYEIVIENQILMRTVLMDLFLQINGMDGKAVLSEEEKPIPISKNMEIIDRFIPFDLSKKTIINKIVSELEQRSTDPSIYSDTLEMTSSVEKYLYDLSDGMIGNLVFGPVSISSLIKSAGLSLNEEYESLGEKIVDYFDLVIEYEKYKLFVLVGVRSYLSDKETDAFIDTICRRGYRVVLIEPVEHLRIDKIKRYIIDNDLCEIW